MSPSDFSTLWLLGGLVFGALAHNRAEKLFLPAWRWAIAGFLTGPVFYLLIAKQAPSPDLFRKHLDKTMFEDYGTRIRGTLKYKYTIGARTVHSRQIATELLNFRDSIRLQMDIESLIADLTDYSLPTIFNKDRFVEDSFLFPSSLCAVAADSLGQQKDISISSFMAQQIIDALKGHARKQGVPEPRLAILAISQRYLKNQGGMPLDTYPSPPETDIEQPSTEYSAEAQQAIEFLEDLRSRFHTNIAYSFMLNGKTVTAKAIANDLFLFTLAAIKRGTSKDNPEGFMDTLNMTQWMLTKNHQFEGPLDDVTGTHRMAAGKLALTLLSFFEDTESEYGVPKPALVTQALETRWRVQIALARKSGFGK